MMAGRTMTQLAWHRRLARSLHEGFDLSSTTWNLILRPRTNVPGCWRERFASSGTKSQSHPSTLRAEPLRDVFV
jgi:hypothetical protein